MDHLIGTGLGISWQNWVGLTLIWDVSPSCPTCSATSAHFPLAQMELGRGWDKSKSTQPRFSRRYLTLYTGSNFYPTVDDFQSTERFPQIPGNRSRWRREGSLPRQNSRSARARWDSSTRLPVGINDYLQITSTYRIMYLEIKRVLIHDFSGWNLLNIPFSISPPLSSRKLRSPRPASTCTRNRSWSATSINLAT